MTDLSDSARILVDYANADPTSSLSAVADAVGYDFSYTSDDLDFIVNALITGFEQLAYSVTVDGALTSLFDDLINTGMQSLTFAQLAIFGTGNHTLQIVVSDLAGAQSISEFVFNAGDVPPIPVPPALGLMLIGLGFLGALGGFRRRGTDSA